ncbi:MAG: ThuA domain-containing protein, partial [Phycisphaerae bacterium]|nr:ThuA domain-containing protein [Phycisphaerae bacterium]
MLKHTTRKLALIGLTVLVLFSQGLAGPRKLKPVKEADIKKLTDAAPKKATAKPAKPRKVLVFYLCEGYYHGSIPVGVKCIEIMGQKTGAYETVISQDMEMFSDEKLKDFDLVLFMNTTRLKFKDETKRNALLKFVKSGKGVAGMHAASDNF